MSNKKTLTYTQILDCLWDLFSSYPIQKITTRQIADACEISTRTFYNYFYDKYDAAAAMYLHIVKPYIYENLTAWYNHGCDLNDTTITIVHNCLLSQDNNPIIDTYKKVEYEKLKMHILPEAYQNPDTAHEIECALIFFINGMKGLLHDLFLQSSFVAPLFADRDFLLDAKMAYQLFPESLQPYFSDAVVREPSKELLALFENRNL